MTSKTQSGEQAAFDGEGVTLDLGPRGPGADLPLLEQGPSPKRFETTVPLPKSLPELEQGVQLELGVTWRHKLYHKEREIYHNAAISLLQDGDVVVVRPCKERGQPFQGISDYEAEYVKHPLTSHEPRKTAPDTRPQTGPFEGMSSYVRDYVRHDLSGRTPRIKPNLASSVFRPQTSAQTGRTSYREHFNWKQGATTHRAPSSKKSAMQEIFHGVPFEGRSSYTEDYRGRQREAQEPVVIEKASVLTDALMTYRFKGQSVYTADYIKHPLGAQKNFKPEQTAVYNPHNLKGRSEYRTQYTPRSQKVPLLNLQYKD